MDVVVTGALSSLILKLGNVIFGEYKLQKGVKGEIMFLQPELESMRCALKEIENIPADQLDNQDKIWASEVRELCYDIEDSIDMFIVRCSDDDGSETPAGPYGMKKFINRSLDLLTTFHNRRNLANDIRGIKRRLVEVHERHKKYKLGGVVAKPATIDPRLLAYCTTMAELVGIDDRRDELIKFLGECGDEVSTKKGKIVSIVGVGGLGKTTLANSVYLKIKAQFDCCAFVSVSQTPDMKKLLKGLLYDLGNNIQQEYTLDERRLIDELKAFLEDKRYFIVIDDIWDISVSKMIRCALPHNKCGYRVITTTRIYDVANKEAGCVYHMKSLSHRKSKILFYSRIFGTEIKDNNDKCPYEQLVEVSDKILKKCAGVPLAIITIASLLASKGANKVEWSEVCSAIGVGLENSMDVENMRKILSFSYYDIPSYLRKCLLYFSVFPEDYEIDRDRLIRLWIAEDFIGCEKQGKSLFDIGESYLNELINRNMIQPVYHGSPSFDKMRVVSYRIHDMILELIRSLSKEQNFVTIWNDADQKCPSKKVVHRICFHSSKEDRITSKTTMSIERVRSVVVFPPASNLMPPLRSFNVLRVLDLEHCNLSKAYSSLKYLGNLFHLRYLGLRWTGISQLPEELGNLKFLQTLDVSFTVTYRLPATVLELKHLMSLLGGDSYAISLPNGIGRLTSLEELSYVYIGDDDIEELGNLTKLKVLNMDWEARWNSDKRMVECLNKLQNIQHLSIIWRWITAYEAKCTLDGWVAPPHLSVLQLCCWLSRLPDSINPSLRDLWCVQIRVRELRQEDLQILGRLPALRSLHLMVDHVKLGITRRFVVGACSFPCLVDCTLIGFGGPVEFRQGAMPSLRSLTVWLEYGGSSEEVEEAKAAVRHAMQIHPNHPSCRIHIGSESQVQMTRNHQLVKIKSHIQMNDEPERRCQVIVEPLQFATLA